MPKLEIKVGDIIQRHRDYKAIPLKESRIFHCVVTNQSEVVPEKEADFFRLGM